MNKFLWMIMLITSLADAGDIYYVATDGDDDLHDGLSLNQPWQSIDKSIGKLKAGDTLLIRGGTYNEINISSFPINEASSLDRILIKNYQNENVIVTGAINLQNVNWTQHSGNIYKYESGSTRYLNISQDNIPLQLMNNTGDVSELVAAGQWVYDKSAGTIYLHTKGGGNPSQHNIEGSETSSIFKFNEGADYITLEGLTLQNAFYGARVYSDYVELKDLVVRNVYGDGLKVEGWIASGWEGSTPPSGITQYSQAHWDDFRVNSAESEFDSIHGLIEGCDIYHFGESAIDITGGDYWTVKENRFHHAVAVRNNDMNGYYTNALMIKNQNIGTMVENNVFHDMYNYFGAISIGGRSRYAYSPNDHVSNDIVVRNNSFINISGPFLVTFSGAINSVFANNLVVDGDFSVENNISSAKSYFQFRNGYCAHSHCTNTVGVTHYNSENNTIINNVFRSSNDPVENHYYELEIQGDHDINNVIDNNYFSTAKSSKFNSSTQTLLSDLQALGYEQNSHYGSNIGVKDASKGLYSFAAKDDVGVNEGLAHNDIGLTDLDALPRNNISNVDVGPYEYNDTTVYEDGTSIDGWHDGSAAIPINTIFDSELGHSVIEIGGGSSDVVWHFLESSADISHSEQIISWFGKSSIAHKFDIRIKTNAGAFRHIKFQSELTGKVVTSAPSVVRFPLGQGNNHSVNNEWHHYTYDIQALLDEAYDAAGIAFEDIEYIERIYSTGGVAIDDIRLSNDALVAQQPLNEVGAWYFNEGQGKWSANQKGNDHAELFGLGSGGNLNPEESGWANGQNLFGVKFTGQTNQKIESYTSGSFTDGITFSMWVNLDSDDSSQNYKALISSVTGDAQYPRVFQMHGHRFQVQFKDSNSNLLTFNSANNVVTPGQWQHILVRIDVANGDADIYIDGVKSGSGLLFTPSGLSTGLDPVRIGASLSSHVISGRVDGVRIFDRAIDPSEINAIVSFYN